MVKKFFRRRANQGEIEADIEDYLAEKTEALMAAGLPPEEARQRARREFGNVTRMKELSSEEWSWAFVDRLLGDIRYALRSLGKNPAFAATAVMTLALGIGANAAIFSLLHAVILRTLPVPDAEQLRLFSVIRDQKEDESIFSFPILREMQAAAAENKAALAGFASIAQMKSVSAGGEDELLSAQMVSGNFFDVMGVKAQAGRLLSTADDNLSGTYPVVLSDAYWSKHFANDPGVIGRALSLNGTPVTIVGIAGKGFFGLRPGNRLDCWLPLAAQHDVRYHQNVWNSNGDAAKSFISQAEIRWIEVVARIYDKQAEARTASLLNRIYLGDMQREAKSRDDPAEVRELLQSKIVLNAGDKGMSNLRDRFSEPLTVLMCAAGLVLLIASVNLASLALARVISRRKEIAVRCSIGATRGRIISQFITEVLVLSLAGGALAIPVALGASKLLVRWASNGDPMPLHIGVDGPLLLFVLLASLAAGLVFGLLPALEAINFPLADAMKTHAASVKGMRLPWGRTLIAIQVTFSFVLLTGAVLFVRTFINYANVQLGFAPEHVLSLTVDPLGAHYSTDQLLPTYRRVMESVREIPGVQSAAFADSGLARHSVSSSGIDIEGKPGQGQNIQENYVSPEYFVTVGMRLVAGRFFDYHDLAKKPILAVINAAAAKKFYPGVSPMGKHFGYGGDLGRFEVIGILADARVNDLHEEARPMAYYSLEQSPQYARSLEVRAQGDPKVLEQSIRSAIHANVPTLPVMEVKTLREQVASNLLRERLVARLASAFAVLALALACLGVYGVLSYAISRRIPELGIRLALGAETASVRWMVLREALAVILIGLAFGIPVSIGITRLIQGLLYGLSASDPVSIAAGAFALLAAGFMAAFVPAWRASHVDPNVALRYE